MRKFIPEWTPQEAVLMALPNNNTDWAYILHEAQLQYARIIETLTKEGVRVVLLCDDIEEAEVLLKTLLLRMSPSLIFLITTPGLATMAPFPL